MDDFIFSNQLTSGNAARELASEQSELMQQPMQQSVQPKDLPSESSEKTDSGINFRRGANTVRKRSALGRGLSALLSPGAVSIDLENDFSNTAHAAPEINQPTLIHHTHPTELNSAEEQTIGGLAYLPIDQVKPNPNQPRQYFPQEEIDSLSLSIKDSGLLQPIIVRRYPGQAGPLASYEIVAGERRFRAAKIAGLKRIPALVRQLTDRETAQFGLVENAQRSDLNPIEEAQAYQRLIHDFNLTQEEIAQLVYRDRTSISNSLRLLKLSTPIQEFVISKQISAGHARALLTLDDQEQALALAKRICSEDLSVRETERLAQTSFNSEPTLPPLTIARSLPPPTPPEVNPIEERFRRALGTKVKLKLNNKGKGELRISFYSHSELDNLLEMIGA